MLAADLQTGIFFSNRNKFRICLSLLPSGGGIITSIFTSVSSHEVRVHKIFYCVKNGELQFSSYKNFVFLWLFDFFSQYFSWQLSSYEQVCIALALIFVFYILRYHSHLYLKLTFTLAIETLPWNHFLYFESMFFWARCSHQNFKTFQTDFWHFFRDSVRGLKSSS